MRHAFYGSSCILFEARKYLDLVVDPVLLLTCFLVMTAYFLCFLCIYIMCAVLYHESNESLRQVDNVHDVYWKLAGGLPFQVGSFLFKRGVLQ